MTRTNYTGDPKQPPTGLLVLFCLVFIPCGVWGVVEAVGAAADARKVEAPGVVIETRVRRDEGLSRKTPWLSEWLVEYPADGGNYQQWFTVRAHAYEEDARGGDVTGRNQPVWFDPAAPDQATAVPPEPGRRALTAGVCMFAGLGGLGSLYVLCRRLTRRM